MIRTLFTYVYIPDGRLVKSLLDPIQLSEVINRDQYKTITVYPEEWEVIDQVSFEDDISEYLDLDSLPDMYDDDYLDSTTEKIKTKYHTNYKQEIPYVSDTPGYYRGNF